MDIIIVKDGTVPVAVGKVLATDGAIEAVREHLYHDGHEYVELFSVPDSVSFLGLTWFDGDGFNVTGFGSILDGLAWLGEFDSPGDTPVNEYGPTHWGCTYRPGDDEGYGHLFDIR